VPILEKLVSDFPERQIRILFESTGGATNHKVKKLDRLVREARHEIIVINDSDMRARPDYLRNVVAPLADPKVGAVTCFYLPIEEKGFAEALQNVSMVSDFYAGVPICLIAFLPNASWIPFQL
jgi:ceramide glucosyltransferase